MHTIKLDARHTITQEEDGSLLLERSERSYELKLYLAIGWYGMVAIMGLGIFYAAKPSGEDVKDTLLFLGAACVLGFVFVPGLLAYFLNYEQWHFTPNKMEHRSLWRVRYIGRDYYSEISDCSILIRYTPPCKANSDKNQWEISLGKPNSEGMEKIHLVYFIEPKRGNLRTLRDLATEISQATGWEIIDEPNPPLPKTHPIN